MRKIFLALTLAVTAILMLTLNSCKKDDSSSNTEVFLAPLNEQYRVALIEDFTGVRCQYCPAGHDAAKSIVDANPGKVLVLAEHGGSFGIPSNGWPNFTTPWVVEIAALSKLGGYPAGMISRRTAAAFSLPPQNTDPTVKNPYALGRANWNSAVQQMIVMKAPVNIGARAIFDPLSRNLQVRVDLYYYSDVSGVNNINVAVVQDKLIGKQYLEGNVPEPNYVQNNVLRDLITGQWGDTCSTTKAKSKVTRIYNYTLPSDYNGAGADGGGAVVLANTRIVVFICKGQIDVLNALNVQIQ
jgi:hypothetical protein